MKFNITRQLLFLALVALSAFGAFAQNNLQVNLHGNIDGDHVKLYWEVRGWPTDMEGFNLSLIHI